MSWGRLLVGAILVALGVVFLLDQAGAVDAGDVIGRWWPTVLLAIGAVQLIANPRHWLGPAIVAGVGLMLLVDRLDLVTGSVWPIFWAAVLIIVGLRLILGGGTSRRSVRLGHARDDINSFVAFGRTDQVVRSEAFRGGSLVTLFGGTTLDLTQATPDPKGVALDVLVAFGGTDILVSDGWRVRMRGIPLFGGWSNKVKGEASSDGPELSVYVVALFGGAEVKKG